MVHKPKIMIIDDVEMNRNLLEILFEDISDLISVESGEEAIESMKTFVPDLVLLDVMMPGMDGCEVCHYIRANDQLSAMKILMLSGNLAEEEEERCIQFGADEYISKPFEAIELRSRVIQILGDNNT